MTRFLPSVPLPSVVFGVPRFSVYSLELFIILVKIPLSVLKGQFLLHQPVLNLFEGLAMGLQSLLLFCVLFTSRSEVAR